MGRENLLDPLMSNPILKIRDGALPSVQSKHPWLLGTSLQKSIQPIAKDAVVDLVDGKDRWMARGIFNPDSKIAVRLYSWDQSQELDTAFFRSRINDATAMREIERPFSLEKPYTARRLIFSEADRLSGLIVESYGPYLVIQITASGLLARLDEIVQILRERLNPSGALLMIDQSTAMREGIAEQHQVLFGEIPSEGIDIVENGVLFHVDLLTGQKTGYYLDQRENRLAVTQWIKDGSKVLDVCCYSGGFACTIAKHRPETQITAIDTSQKALDLAAQNVALNGLSNVSFECNDFFSALEQRLERNELYNAIVLDPPKMANARSQVPRALAAYHRLNYMATKLIEPGGVLVTCSCSGRVTREDFRQMLLGVSKRSGREIQVLEQRGAAGDHPTIINCPETDYLKCFVVKIF